MNSNQHIWVVILAAGEGERLRDLTRDRWGQPAPKQYSTIDGQTTLLRTTLERARKIASPERIVPRPGERDGLHPIAAFREKPDAVTAASVLGRGALQVVA
jgi:mannose-1-phosphate guanylyltransferase